IEQRQGAAAVAAAGVVQPDAELQQPLVETAHLTTLGQPRSLEHLVGLEPSPSVEQPHPLDQQRRRRLRRAHRTTSAAVAATPGPGCSTHDRGLPSPTRAIASSIARRHPPAPSWTTRATADPPKPAPTSRAPRQPGCAAAAATTASSAGVETA